MAKYDIDYACGHGSFVEQMYGKVADRESRAAWLSAKKVCPDCYKAKMAAQDSAAQKIATIKLMPGREAVIVIEVAGQIGKNKDALLALGFCWADAQNGLLGYFSASRPSRAFALSKKITSADDAAAWISAAQKSLADLGYAMADGLSDLDLAYLANILAKNAQTNAAKSDAITKLDAIKMSDPRPGTAQLRVRIDAICAQKNAKWNGKIYGKKGGFNFYVANANYSATDAEVADREAILINQAAWDAKYAAEISATKI